MVDWKPFLFCERRAVVSIGWPQFRLRSYDALLTILTIASCLAIGFLSALLIQRTAGGSDFTETIEVGRLVHLGRYGFNYSFAPRSPAVPGMILRGDTLQGPSASSAIVIENGNPLGPPHVAHVEIDAHGHGRFSHWGTGSIYLSSSDGSDPRTNGRSYELRYRYEIPHWLLVSTTLLVAATLGGFGVRLPLSVTPSRRLIDGSKDFLAIGLLCGGIALVSQVLLLRGHAPLAVLSNGDGGNVASFVAGWLHPARFRHDFLLSDTGNFTFYVSIVLPYVALANVFTQDLGTAYLLQYFPMIFAQLSGFYL